MAFTETSLGDLGHLGVDKLFRLESSKYKDYSAEIVGTVIKTKQSYYKMKSLAGLGPAEDFAEGAPAPLDDFQALFVKNFYPERIGKMLEYSDDWEYSLQFKDILRLQPAIAKSFMLKVNLIAASLDNLGFTDTTRGIVAGETMYQSGHSNGGYPLSNISSTGTNLAFGPLAIEQCVIDLRNQISARGDILDNYGDIVIKYPNALEGRAYALANSDKMVGTNNNDAAFAKHGISYVRIPFYTSPTAWFARLKDNEEQGQFLIHFKPYSIEKLAKDERLFNRYVASQKLTVGWRMAQGTWGTAGA